MEVVADEAPTTAAQLLFEVYFDSVLGC